MLKVGDALCPHGIMEEVAAKEERRAIWRIREHGRVKHVRNELHRPLCACLCGGDGLVEGHHPHRHSAAVQAGARAHKMSGKRVEEGGRGFEALAPSPHMLGEAEGKGAGQHAGSCAKVDAHTRLRHTHVAREGDLHRQGADDCGARKLDRPTPLCEQARRGSRGGRSRNGTGVPEVIGGSRPACAPPSPQRWATVGRGRVASVVSAFSSLVSHLTNFIFHACPPECSCIS